MKVKCIDNFGCGKLTLGKIYTVINEKEEYYKVKNDAGIELLHYKNRFEIVKEGNKMGKTFKEVIADIKEGEVWEITKGNNIEISLSKNGVTLDFKKSIECEKIFFPNDTKFKLKREEYTFEEAFKAYEEGKEVESCNFRYKKIEGKDSYYDQIIDNWENRYDVDFSLEEIRNKWYIND